MPYYAHPGEARQCRVCGRWFKPKAVNSLDCSYLCHKETERKNAVESRKERIAKRALMEKLRPGSARRLEDL